MASPAYFPEGSTGKPNDTQLRILQKILGSLNDGGGSGGSGGISNGVVDPTVAPSNTSITNIYINTATKTEWVWPAGGSAWNQIV